MIVNAYAIVAGVLVVIRLPIAILVLGLALRACRQPRTSAETQRRDDRYYLLVLSATLLLGLNLLAWPVFYALLQSYVSQWPGVMCIYGVTQIGQGSQGLSRFLPSLLYALQVAKPLVVFASGAWFMLYLTNRSLQKSELMPRTLALMMLFALISAGDAALEGAYLLTPKSEQFLDVGCCAAALDVSQTTERFVPSGLLAESDRSWVKLAYYVLNAGLPLGLLACHFRISRNWLVFPLLVALVSLPVNWLYLVDIAAPAILRLPYHHCPYDLLPEAPETVIGMALFLFGVFAVGWAWLVDRFGRVAAEVDNGTPQLRQRLLFLAAFGFLSSLVLFTIEVALA